MGRMLRGGGVAVLVCLLSVSIAEAYPDKTITVIHGFAPGGGADILLRIVTAKLSEALGQPVVIDYRAGAGGNIGFATVARARPDGYTLLMGTPGLAINPSLYSNLGFDPQKDFVPLSLIGSVPTVLVIHPSVPASSVQELVALAKAKPGKLNYASSGIGTSLHLAAELFKISAGIDVVHVPYKGGLQAVTDVLGGQVEMMFNVLPSALPHIKAGKLRALAVTGKTRSAALPEAPTMIEAGVRGYTAVTWNGLLAPAGTPKDIVTKLNAAIVKVMSAPDMKEKLAAIGQDPLWSTPEEFAGFLREEAEKWSRVVKAAGIVAQ